MDIYVMHNHEVKRNNLIRWISHSAARTQLFCMNLYHSLCARWYVFKATYLVRHKIEDRFDIGQHRTFIRSMLDIYADPQIQSDNIIGHLQIYMYNLSDN